MVCGFRDFICFLAWQLPVGKTHLSWAGGWWIQLCSLEALKCVGTAGLLAWRRTRAPWVASDSAGGHLPTLPPAGPDNTACFSVPCRPKKRQDKESGAVLMRGDREDSSSIGSQIAKEGNVNIVSWMRRQECGNVGGESTVWKGRWGRSCRRKRNSYVIKCC